MTRIIRKCELCDTVLEFALDDGRTVEFVAHDDAFCRREMKARISALTRALEENGQLWQRSIEAIRRQVDNLLQRRGLPTLAELGVSVEREALAQRLILELGPPITIDQLRCDLFPKGPKP